MFTLQRLCYTPASCFSERVEIWIVLDFPCPVSSLDHVRPDTMIGILKNGVTLFFHTCEG